MVSDWQFTIKKYGAGDRFRLETIILRYESREYDAFCVIIITIIFKKLVP